ncbi:MAG TPA: ankyrin repeat domain-containing protein [Terracidiphilus sp.]|nr:ankyrin repeat domain-containing protein [Terracidiphilus sp.]
MSEQFLKLIQKGAAAEVVEAVQADPAVVVYRDANDVSMLLWAVYAGQPAIRDFLRTRLAAADIPLDLFEAAATGEEARLQAILSQNETAVEAFSGDGWTALHLAAAFGTPLSVATLIFRGARVDVVSKNGQRNQPLHAAMALAKNRSTVELLLTNGADPNATQAGGFTPIFSAAAANRRDLAELLVNNGANPHHANDGGKTPGDFARQHGHEELATWLEGQTAEVVD